MQDFTVGDLLALYRTNKAWTQSQVVEQLEIAIRTYQYWESGKIIPAHKWLLRLVNVFHLTEAEANELYHAAAQIGPEIHNLPFPRSPFFTGREKHLELLDSNFKTNKGEKSNRVISMSGLGGIGKTQLALEYAHRRYPKVYRTVLWVNAADKALLEKSYLVLASLLHLSSKENQEVDHIIFDVKNWLEEHTSWLLVLDNADDLEMALSFLPVRGSGHILLTTRSPIQGNIAKVIEVERMEPGEGLLFLLRRSHLLEKQAELDTIASPICDSARHLVKMLGGHPLALDQVGTYIEETGISFDEYIRIYSQERHKLLNRRGSPGNEHPEPVSITLKISIQRAAEASPAILHVLHFCSVLQSDALPKELFRQGESLNLDVYMFNEAIAVLRRYSLIKHVPEEKLFFIHRLVQAVVQDSFLEAEQEMWIERVIVALNHVFPEGTYSNWSQCQRLIPHMLACATRILSSEKMSLDRATLFFNTANYRHRRTQYAEVEVLYRRALFILERVLGPEHAEIVRVLNCLAEFLRERARYEEAEPLYLKALSMGERTLGPNHYRVIYIRNNLSILYKTRAKYVEAEESYLHILHLWEQIRSPDHPDVAPTLNNLAVLYEGLGRLAEAEPLYQRALAIWEKAFGSEHPEVATALNNLAQCYIGQQGHMEEVLPLYERALRIREAALGSEHPLVATVINNLGEFYAAQHDYVKAEQLYKRALSIQEQAQGDEHPDVFYPLYGLARLSAEQHRYTEAAWYFRRTLSICESAFGSEHPFTLRVQHDFVQLQEEQGGNLLFETRMPEE